MTIRILPPQVAAQIAAGEVIERPSAVVKELIENALDAGATAITVQIQDGGKRLIQVTDNGTGIAEQEITLAFQRHATSKLSRVEDLDHIATLGFRGEALASIAAVSRTTIVSRTADQPHGVRLYLEGGEIHSQEAVGAPVGTSVSVEDLFYNMPARLKFLKREATERQQINLLTSHYAMAYPGVRFQLRQANQEILQTSGSSDLRDVLGQVYGLETLKEMVEIQTPDQPPEREDLPPITVQGFIGLPSLNRANRNQITLFVNGRWIQDSGLSFAVVQAYHTMLMVGRYPVAIVVISLPAEEVDVNVHPTKSQVRFRRADAVFSAVQRAVRGTLIESAPPRPATGEVVWGAPEWATRRERLSQIVSARISQLGLDIEGDDLGQHRHQQPVSEEDAEQSKQAHPDSKGRSRALPVLRVVGQVGATYLVAEGPRGLYLVDQHAAHERILYEQFMNAGKSDTPASQSLLEAIPVELAPDQMALVESSLHDLEAAGFVIELFGRNTVRVLAVPALVAQSHPAEAFLAAIGEIECGEIPVEATSEQRLIARICKQAAVKAGQVLSFAEMQALIRQLEECQSPQTCPHGRPTMMHISAEELARQFGRLGAT